MPSFFSILLLISASAAREITFPPVAAYQAPFLSNNVDKPVYGEIDISSANFAGLTTFANLPYVHCLASDEGAVDKYDIAILGAPFDTVGHFPLMFLHWKYEKGPELYIQLQWNKTETDEFLGCYWTARRAIWTWWYQTGIATYHSRDGIQCLHRPEHIQAMGKNSRLRRCTSNSLGELRQKSISLLWETS